MLATTFPMNDFFNMKTVRDTSARHVSQQTLDYRAKLHEDKLLLTVDVPGVKPDDLSVEHLDGYLTIKAKREETEQLLSLRIINEDYELDELTARADLGVLYLEIPKRPKKVPRKVQIL